MYKSSARFNRETPLARAFMLIYMFETQPQFEQQRRLHNLMRPMTNARALNHMRKMF